MPVRARSVLLGLLAVLFALAACSSRHGSTHGKIAASPNVPGADLAHGKIVYARECAACHGATGSGGQIGPSLIGEHARRSHEAVRAIVLDPQPPMPKLYPSRLSKADVRDVSAYVDSL